MLAAAGCPVDRSLWVPGYFNQLEEEPTLTGWLRCVVQQRGARQQALRGTTLEVARALVQAAVVERAQAAASRAAHPAKTAFKAALSELCDRVGRLPQRKEVGELLGGSPLR